MNWWEVLVQQSINGLTRGSVFALVAIGYTMVYGIIELINFAHGDLFMLGAFLALTLVVDLGLGSGHGSSAWMVWALSAPFFVLGFNSAPAYLKARWPRWTAEAATGLV